MADLPDLPDPTKRKLVVHWDTLVDKHDLTEEHLAAYDRERRRLLGIATDPRRRGIDRSRPKLAADQLGLGASVRAAEERFRGLDPEYWSRWCCGGFQYEVYRDWLASVTRQISAELASIWKGRSDSTDRWYGRVCRPAVEKALAALVKQRLAQARDVELKGPYRAATMDKKSSPGDANVEAQTPAAENAEALKGTIPGTDGATSRGVSPEPTLEANNGESARAQEATVRESDRRTNRSAVVNAFLLQCNQESAVGFKVRRKHIWLAAGHTHARQFQYWQEGSDKATDEDDRNFRRILSMAPAEFMALLKKKGIVSATS